MKRIAFLIWAIFIFSLAANAASNGGYAGSFLQLGLGAQSMALGNTGLAGYNTYSVFYNPALGAKVQGKMAALSYSFMSLDRKFNFVGYSMAIPREAGITVGWINAGVNDIPMVSEIGEITGNVEHSVNAAFFTFGRHFGSKLAVGVTLKLLWESMNFGTDAYSSNGVGFDFGLLYMVNDNVLLSAAVRDVGSKLKANTADLFEHGGTTIDYFPQKYHFGVRYRTPLPWLRVLYEAELSSQSVFVNHAGIEAAHKDLLALRVGLNGSNPTFGAGMGFHFMRFKSKLDYAFIPSLIDEGSSHVFSWLIAF